MRAGALLLFLFSLSFAQKLLQPSNVTNKFDKMYWVNGETAEVYRKIYNSYQFYYLPASIFKQSDLVDECLSDFNVSILENNDSLLLKIYPKNSTLLICVRDTFVMEIEYLILLQLTICKQTHKF